MMVVLRRLLVLAGLFFWQGGFTFYAAVVVPVGQQVLGSHFDQGLITRQVTNYLNLAGGIALLLLAWDAAAGRQSFRKRGLRWGCLLGMGLALALLVWLHLRLDALFAPDESRLLDRQAFRSLHRLYLWISTIQWALALVYGAVALLAWREQDRSQTEARLAVP
jgi:hypothetical protein